MIFELHVFMLLHNLIYLYLYICRFVCIPLCVYVCTIKVVLVWHQFRFGKANQNENNLDLRIQELE